MAPIRSSENRSPKVAGCPPKRSPLLILTSSAAECQALFLAPDRRSCNSVIIAQCNRTAACDRDLPRSSFRRVLVAFLPDYSPKLHLSTRFAQGSIFAIGRPGCGIRSVPPEQGSRSLSAQRERVAVPLGRLVALGGLPKNSCECRRCVSGQRRARDESRLFLLHSH